MDAGWCSPMKTCNCHIGKAMGARLLVGGKFLKGAYVLWILGKRGDENSLPLLFWSGVLDGNGLL